MSVEHVHEVTSADTALAVGSGDVEVLGTPRLVAWFEAATVAVATTIVDDSETSVGTGMRIRHRRPTPIGGVIRVRVELTVRSGARLTFAVSALDESGATVADGEIDRAVVNRADFGRGD